jgi:glucokinase
VDDYISKRGILRLMRQAGLDTAHLDVKQLAEMATGGDATASGIFREFGGMIGEMLVPFIRSFQPEAIVIGGQIAKSQHLFLDSTREALRDFRVALEVSDETSVSTFVGVSRLLQQYRNLAKS